jgi:hypothetical protein
MSKKITQLPANSGLDGTEKLEMVQGGISKRVTVSEVASFIGGGVSGLTPGRIPFAFDDTTLIDSSQLFWDSANSRLGVGTSTPSYKLHVTSDSAINGKVYFGSTVDAYVDAVSGTGLKMYVWDNVSAYAERFRISHTGKVSFLTSPSNDNALTKILAWDATGEIKYVNSALVFQPLDAGLTSIAGLTTSADKMIYTTASDVYATTTLSSFGRTLIDDADASTARTTLGLVIGTNVQAFDAELSAIAGLTSAADKVPYFTGSGTAALATLSSFARTLIDDADATTARDTLGIPIYRLATTITGGATLRNIGTSPVTLIAAPGANKYLNIISVTVSYKYSTAAYDHSQQVIFSTVGIGAPFFSDAWYLIDGSGANALNSYASDFTVRLVGTVVDGSSRSIQVNREFALRTLSGGGNATTGSGDIDVVVYYTIEDANT